MRLKDLHRPAIPLSGGCAWFAEDSPGVMVRLFAEEGALQALGGDFDAARAQLVEIASRKMEHFQQEPDHTVIIRTEDACPPQD